MRPMNEKTTPRTSARTPAGFLLLLFLTVLLIGLNFFTGSTCMSAKELAAALAGRDATAAAILFEIRLPRLIAAGVLGGALAVSGFLLQTFFANPIAGPYILGISSGARLTVTAAMLFFAGSGLAFSSVAMIVTAFAGSMLSMGLILLIAVRVHRMSFLVICGVMIGYLCTAATDFLVTFAADSQIASLHYWSVGSFSGISMDEVCFFTPIVLTALLLAFLLSKPLSAYQLGEAYAKSLGVDVRRFRVELILLSSLFSAAVTAFAGPVSFVGIAVPQLMKGLFRTARPLILVPACFLGGAVFCLFSDWIARTAFSPNELGIGSVTAFLGAPVVLWVLLRRRTLSRGEE